MHRKRERERVKFLGLFLIIPINSIQQWHALYPIENVFDWYPTPVVVVVVVMHSNSLN